MVILTTFPTQSLMKKVLRILGWLLLSILLIVIGTLIYLSISWQNTSKANLAQLTEAAPTLTASDGHTYRDLNKNSTLDPYEDERVDIPNRVENLLSQMTLEEKAGAMFINMIGMEPDGELNEIPSPAAPFAALLGANSTLVVEKQMNHFNIIQSTTPKAMATWHNKLQQMAERTRLGIPITIASDPRHVTQENIGAGIKTPAFSAWPGPLGMAATRDTTLVKAFGHIAREEYKAVGIRLALSPMADLATEPRWGRANGTFGEDAQLSAAMTKAYILGFQGDSLDTESVACMVKHFSGGGPQKDGEDAHFPYGKDQVYPGDNFDYHLIPFEEGAFPARVSQIMPYYGVPVGQTQEEVAFGYNKEIITGLLREKYQFDGIICTDWGLVSTVGLEPLVILKPASDFGVEHLTEVEKVAKIINAGCDMFGGENTPNWVVQAVEQNLIDEARIDQSLRRILREKFTLGLFDNPYLPIDVMPALDNIDHLKLGRSAQQKSLVLLKNNQRILPLSTTTKVHLIGFSEDIDYPGMQVVEDPNQADVIIQKLFTPFDPRNSYVLESMFHQGRLHFTEEEKAEMLPRMEATPTITVMNLERPAVIPEIDRLSKALIADFDCQDDIILDLIFGKFTPSGKLPIELPSSTKAVSNQKEDVPYDSANPLYPFGSGLQGFWLTK